MSTYRSSQCIFAYNCKCISQRSERISILWNVSIEKNTETLNVSFFLFFNVCLLLLLRPVGEEKSLRLFTDNKKEFLSNTYFSHSYSILSPPPLPKLIFIIGTKISEAGGNQNLIIISFQIQI